MPRRCAALLPGYEDRSLVARKERSGIRDRRLDLPPGRRCVTHHEGGQGLLADVDPKVRDELLALTPLSRFGRPEDIAGAIAFLAGPGADWMTRQNLAVDGGIVGR